MTWRPKFSITNLILLTVIVALCVALWQERRQAADQLQRVRSDLARARSAGLNVGRELANTRRLLDALNAELIAGQNEQGRANRD